MVKSKSILECPYCTEVFEVESPDKTRTMFSKARPISTTFLENIKIKKHECKNPECKKKVTLYWYSPVDYFSRV